MRYKIIRTQKFMWRNIMRPTKSQKVSVLYYSIDVRGSKVDFSQNLLTCHLL